jgi:Skp family chaperone for outer membrane proteins
MNTITRTLLSGGIALGAIAATATAAAAQAAPIVVVDMDRIGAESAAMKAAEPQLKAKAQSVQARAKALGDQFRGEAETLQKAQASMAKEAFQAKVKDLQTRQVAAENEVRGREQDYARSVQYVRAQILEAVNPIITAIMREKGASIAMDRGATLAVAQSLDVTSEVLTRLNAAKPTVSINPPAQPAKN